MTAPKGVDPQAIWQMYEAGITQVRIAKNLGIARNTVIYHLKRLTQKENGSDGLTPAPPVTTTTEAVDSTFTDNSTTASKTTKTEDEN